MPSAARRLLLPAIATIVIVAATVAGCGGGDSPGSGGSLTLYSAGNERQTDGLVKAFEAKTGATVRVRLGEDEGLANQIVQEGSASPADVFLSENTPPLMLLSQKGLLAKVDPSTLAGVPARYSSPAGRWVGVAARETVLIYNPRLIPPAQLPGSILDLSQPRWKGKLAIAPSEPDFVPLVGAISKLRGRAVAESWLSAFAANAKRYNDNEGIVAAVESGQVGAGVINHYYWFARAAEVGRQNMSSRLYYFGNRDPGALVNISGAAVLGSSQNQKLAQEFVAFMVSREGQEAIVRSGDFEYPLVSGVAPAAGLKPFARLDPPNVTPADLGDGSSSVRLLQQAGLL